MTSLKSKQTGFTIVELLIVIVVIGILAALVITTFNGIQQKGRDTERQTDIKAIHGQLEAAFAQFGYYPTLAELTNAGGSTWRTDNMKGLDVAALEDPSGAVITSTAATAGSRTYSYIPSPANCDNAAPETNCTGYQLAAGLEGEIDGQQVYTKDSLNNSN
jgi:prepilin-type N-terminal cleavage/methylation domain-containing protein